MTTYKQRYAHAFKELAAKMDKQDRYRQLLKDYYIKHGEIPKGHEAQYNIGRLERFQSWRNQPKIVKRIQKSAKKLARNERKLNDNS